MAEDCSGLHAGMGTSCIAEGVGKLSSYEKPASSVLTSGNEAEKLEMVHNYMTLRL